MWAQATWRIWVIKALIVTLVLYYQQSDHVSIAGELNELTEVLGYGNVLFLALLVYAILLALPYFPSVEIGFAIMVIFGKPGITFAYAATLIGLLVAFLIGKLIQKHGLVNHVFYRVWKSEFTTKLASKSPFLALIMLINLPGNIVLGGGGGIALNYGMTKQLNILTFTLAIAIGVAPLPLLMLLGYSFFSK